jgi:hypothetical protein
MLAGTWEADTAQTVAAASEENGCQFSEEPRAPAFLTERLQKRFLVAGVDHIFTCSRHNRTS